MVDVQAPAERCANIHAEGVFAEAGGDRLDSGSDAAAHGAALHGAALHGATLHGAAVLLLERSWRLL
jgi:hypothetical protein